MRLHHPAGARIRTRATRRRGTGGAEAEDAVARRHDALADGPAGVHAAPRGPGSETKAAPHPFGVRVTSLREVSGPPLREPRCARTQRRVACAGRAAGPTDGAGACLGTEAIEPDEGHRWGSGISWALLLKRVFEIDMQHCPNCGGELKVIAAILDTLVIEASSNTSGYRHDRRHARRRAPRCRTRREQRQTQGPAVASPSVPAPQDAGLVCAGSLHGRSRRHDPVGKPYARRGRIAPTSGSGRSFDDSGPAHGTVGCHIGVT